MNDSLYLGSAIYIEILLNISTAESVTISIENPSAVKIIEDVNMTKKADGVYYYVFQSDKYVEETDNSEEGTYKAEITVLQDGYETVKKIEFTLLKSLNS